MEDDTCFQHEHVDFRVRVAMQVYVLAVAVGRDDGAVSWAGGLCISGGRSSRFGILSTSFALAPQKEALTDVVDEEREEQSRHENGCCSRLVRQFAYTFVAEHEIGMRE